MKANVLKLLDFAGGLNTKQSDTEIADNQCVDILNFEFDPLGDLSKRLGQSRYNSTELTYSGGTATQVYLIKKFYDSDGSTRLLAWGYFYDISGSAKVVLFDDDGSGAFTQVTITDLSNSLLDAAFIRTATLGDKLIFVNGSNVPYWIAKTGNAKRLGIIAPTNTLTLADGGTGGSLTAGAVYKYKLTFVNSTDSVESAPCAEKTIDLSTGQTTVSLSVIPVTADTNVNKVNIYRSLGNATPVVYYYLTQINEGATTYTDTTADASLTVAYDTDVDDHQPPPTDPEFVIEHNNRIFYAGDPAYPYRIYWSMLNQPDYVATNNFIDIGRLDSDLPLAVCVLNDYIWIGSRNGWRKLDAWGISSDWQVSSPVIGPGIFAKRSVAVCDSVRVPLNADSGGTIVYGRKGAILYLSFAGMVVAFDSERYLNLGYVVQDEIDQSPQGVLEDAVGVYYPNRNQYQLSIYDVTIID